MEEMYANEDSAKRTTNKKGSSSSKERLYLGVLIYLWLLNVFLLIRLYSFGVCFKDQGPLTGGLSNIKDNLTHHLQAINDQLALMTEQRDLLNSDITQMSKQLIRFQSLSTQEKKCPKGWNMYGHSCYFLSTNPGSWEEGRNDCKNRGGDLVVIDDANEQVMSELEAQIKDCHASLKLEA
ncbi:C-type lectin domain family 12 member B-like [Cyprinodon tularosa]|uniref:C-type lectin domain family 12 member B-like n=1 Tax=Cyprinodon tularosa TaxID=77115 RepID=UPI0018E2309E|nr:C-type lectin domain family 12 member B-like [Cyprinodon tularosa]